MKPRYASIGLKHITLALVLSVVLITSSLAQEEEPTPTKVHIGVYISGIPSLSLKENSYKVLFFVWFRWQGETLKPFPYESFEIVNGHMEFKEVISTSKVHDFNYAVCRVWASISQNWQVEQFPFDNHEIRLVIEDSASEDHKLVYVPDVENSGIGHVQIPGWRVGHRHAADVKRNIYETNFGDISLPPRHSSYSRFVYSVAAERQGWGYYLRLFSGLHIAVFVAFLALWIQPTDVDPRFGLGAAALFAAVASEFVVASSLPETNILTLADQLHMASLGFIFLSLIESAVSLPLCRANAVASRRLDRISFFALLALYAFVIILLVLIVTT
jgi:hypothetical protein